MAKPYPAKLPTRGKEFKKSLSSERKLQEKKPDKYVIKGESPLPVSESRRTWQCGPCISGIRVKVSRKDLRNIPLNLRKLAETRSVPHGCPERPLCEAMKVNPGFC